MLSHINGKMRKWGKTFKLLNFHRNRTLCRALSRWNVHQLTMSASRTFALPPHPPHTHAYNVHDSQKCVSHTLLNRTANTGWPSVRHRGHFDKSPAYFYFACQCDHIVCCKLLNRVYSFNNIYFSLDQPTHNLCNYIKMDQQKHTQFMAEKSPRKCISLWLGLVLKV